MTVEFIRDCEQGTPEWFKHRICSIGGSSVNGAMAAKGKGATAKTMIRKMIAEKLTGVILETFKSAAMQVGNDREEESRDYLSFSEGFSIDQCALIKNSKYTGMHYSPDGFNHDLKCLVELKNPMGHTQIELLETCKIPTPYIDQMQFGLMIAEYDYCIFMSYVPGIKPFIKRIDADVEYHNEMLGKLSNFFSTMEGIQELIR